MTTDVTKEAECSSLYGTLHKNRSCLRKFSLQYVRTFLRNLQLKLLFFFVNFCCSVDIVEGHGVFTVTMVRRAT